MKTKPVYLDYAATTPVDPRVAEAMAACLTEDGVFANPASRSHFYGWQAEEKVETARGHVAELLSCDPREVVWTSGATEANNLALKGTFEATNFTGHLVTSAVEHKAIIDPARWLEERGVAVTWLQPGADGRIAPETLRDALRPDTRLVSLMQVNNETGAVNPVAELASICREAGVPFHVDAAQAAGKLDVALESTGAELLSLSAHKFYGPKGVGALAVKRRMQRQMVAQLHGGGHERGLRSGTLATHQIVGLGEAARLAAENREAEARSLAALRDALWEGIADLPGLRRNGSAEQVSPAHLNICFSGIDGERLLLSLRDIAVSSGSACTSASMEPSYVLKAMGLSDDDALSSVRLSVGRYTGPEDVERAVACIRQTVSQFQAA